MRPWGVEPSGGVVAGAGMYGLEPVAFTKAEADSFLNDRREKQEQAQRQEQKQILRFVQDDKQGQKQR